MRVQLAAAVSRWRQIPGRTRLGMAIAVLALAGLLWQHYNSTASPTDHSGTHAESVAHPDGADDAGHAHGEWQPDPDAMGPVPDFSPEAARTVVGRFASNFVTPNGNHADWIGRIGPDVMPELLDQYRLTDIRVVPQSAVAEVVGPVGNNPIAPMFQIALSDGSRIETTLEMDESGWKVSTVVPIGNPGPPGQAPGPATDSAAEPAPAAGPPGQGS